MLGAIFAISAMIAVFASYGSCRDVGDLSWRNLITTFVVMFCIIFVVIMIAMMAL
jgi:hypothetical protein